MHRVAVALTILALVASGAVTYLVLRPALGAQHWLAGAAPSVVWAFGLGYLASLIWTSAPVRSKKMIFLVVIAAPALSELLQFVPSVGGTPDLIDAACGTLVVPISWYWGSRCLVQKVSGGS